MPSFYRDAFLSIAGHGEVSRSIAEPSALIGYR
jgi:hypothetical protein